jgi:hypothetical protein
MSWVATMFHQGGMTMYWIEYAGIAALVIVAIAIVSPKRWSQLATIALGIGAYGTMHSRHRVADAVEELSHETPVPPYLEDMRERGAVEANRPIEFAACVAGGLAVLLGISELRRRTFSNG